MAFWFLSDTGEALGFFEPLVGIWTVNIIVVALKGNRTKLFIDECLSAELALMARERAVP